MNFPNSAPLKYQQLRALASFIRYTGIALFEHQSLPCSRLNFSNNHELPPRYRAKAKTTDLLASFARFLPLAVARSRSSLRSGWTTALRYMHLTMKYTTSFSNDNTVASSQIYLKTNFPYTKLSHLHKLRSWEFSTTYGGCFTHV